MSELKETALKTGSSFCPALPKEGDYQKSLLKLVPKAIRIIEDMLESSDTPAATKAMLVNMVLDRALGKPTTPVEVSTDQDNAKAAEKKLMALVMAIQANRETLALGGGLLTEKSSDETEEEELRFGETIAEAERVTAGTDLPVQGFGP